MSASIFADFYIPYSSYLKTEYIEGDIKFGELKPGDILYYLDRYDKMKTIKVISSWHISKNHCYIGVSGKLRNIDFGDEVECHPFIEEEDRLDPDTVQQCRKLFGDLVQETPGASYGKGGILKCISVYSLA